MSQMTKMPASNKLATSPVCVLPRSITLALSLALSARKRAGERGFLLHTPAPSLVSPPPTPSRRETEGDASRDPPPLEGRNTPGVLSYQRTLTVPREVAVEGEMRPEGRRPRVLERRARRKGRVGDGGATGLKTSRRS